MECKSNHVIHHPAKVDSTFDLVRTIVIDLLIQDDERIKLETKEKKFFSDLASTITVTDTIQIYIDSAEHIEKGLSEELTVSGILLDHVEKQHSFTLYFIIEKEALLIPRGKARLNKFIGKTLYVPVPIGPGVLYQSVFKMKLDCVNCNDDAYNFAEGRGYFIFNAKKNRYYLSTIQHKNIDSEDKCLNLKRDTTNRLRYN